MLKPLLMGLSCFAVTAHSQDAGDSAVPSNLVDRPAVFSVSTDVINPNLSAFTFTSDAFGNTLKREGRGSFEPGTFRARFTATADSKDRVVDDSPSGIAYFDSYASGYLDGAEVRVYRIVDGNVELVRLDRVAASGTVIEYWNRQDNKVIPADSTSAEFAWASWSRPDSYRWFTVYAVDKAGNLSEPATPVKVKRVTPQSGAKAHDNEVRYQAIKSDDRKSPPAPTNFSVTTGDDGIVRMHWDPVDAPDLAGYRIARTDTDPASHRGVYLQLEQLGDAASVGVKAGDMVIVSKSLVDFTPDWLSNRLANHTKTIVSHTPTGVPNGYYRDEVPGKTWRLVKHHADDAVPNAGEYYLEMTLRDGDTELVGKHGIPDISTTSQAFYPVPEDDAEYIMEVWMKADRDDAPPVIFTWDGDERVGGFVGQHALQATTQWTKQMVRFRGQSTAVGNHAYLVLKASGPATYSFDNFRVYRADTPYLDYLPYQYDNLAASGMRAFRTHASIKTSFTSYSMRQYLGDAGEAEGIAMGNTLPQSLRMMQKADVQPWLQIEFHMSPEEWLAFVEYMAAPYDPSVDTAESKPFAYLRTQQGRPKPWVDAFDRIYFELGNETWNGLFRPWTFDAMRDSANNQQVPRGEVYGKYHDYVVDTMQASPYWTDALDEKFVHVLGGWSTSLRNGSDGQLATQGYTQEALRASRHGEYITIAAYNGGWDEGEGPPQTTPASYFNVLSQVNQGAIPKAVALAQLEIASQATGHPYRTGTYEAGPGYALNGLNNDRVSREQAVEQEQVMKSKLAGTATLDSFLARAVYGATLQNFFTFDEGDLWKSHALRHNGGQPHASYLPLQLFNHHATGDLLAVDTVSVPTIDTGKSRRRQAVSDAPLAAVYATHRDNRVHVICISRRIAGYPNADDDGFTPMQIKLPFDRCSSLTLYHLTGEPTDTNIQQGNVAIESSSLDPLALASDGTFTINELTGTDARGLPPAEMFLYIFEGVEMPDGRTLSRTQTIERMAPKP